MILCTIVASILTTIVKDNTPQTQVSLHHYIEKKSGVQRNKKLAEFPVNSRVAFKLDISDSRARSFLLHYFLMPWQRRNSYYLQGKNPAL